MENNENKCESCGSAMCCAGDCGKCNCPHHKAIPVFIILIAVAFLLGQWEILDASQVGIIWPILLGAIGITKLMKGRCGCC